MSSPKKLRLAVFNKSSWYKDKKTFASVKDITISDLIKIQAFDVEVEKGNLKEIATDNQPSASYYKINRIFGVSIAESSDDEDEENFDSQESEFELDEDIENCNMWIKIDINILSEILSENTVCRKCHKKVSLSERKSDRAGLGTKFSLQCLNKRCAHESLFNSSIKIGKYYEANRKSALAFRMIGKGYSAVRKVSSVLGLHGPVNAVSFASHTEALKKDLFDICQNSMEEAGKTAKMKEIEIKGRQEKPQPIDIPTSFDGTWNRKAWNSTKGVTTAIAESTSQVIDAVFKSRSCRDCKKAKARRENGDLGEIEYVDWFLDHEENCLKNHEGSAQSMESSSVLEIYKRSIEKHNIRYKPFIGDGDSSSFALIDKERPYGPLVNIEKSECANHVTKRMGSGLRKLLKDNKGKKLSDGKKDGLGGRGRLTLAKCDAIQNFYGRAIRDNKGDPKKMEKEIWAILMHYASKPGKPRHENCPSGKSSWCSYQRDIATGRNTHKPTKLPFSDAMIDSMTPLFKRLSNPVFLESCKRCHTQNPNESFNSLLWSLAPKNQFTSERETALALDIAVCIFNDEWLPTMLKIYEKCGFAKKLRSIQTWKTIDNQRVRSGIYRMTHEQKRKRRIKKHSTYKQLDAFQRNEGIQYQSQGFHVK